jgi:hypothetical protein
MQVTPSWGWILAFEYFVLFFVLLYAKWLHVLWSTARSHGGGIGKVCHLTKLSCSAYVSGANTVGLPAWFTSAADCVKRCNASPTR